MRHDSQPSLLPVVTAGGRQAVAAVVALLAVLGGALVSTAVAAQQNTTNTDTADVRIVARKLESGRIEFGLQQRQDDDSWGDRQLPRVRFFPTTAGINRWLASSPLDLPSDEVRIVARKLESGRIEFGLQQRRSDDSWGDRQLPRVRFFPTTAGINRWLASSPLTLTTSPPADRDTTPTGDDQTAPRPADRDTPATDDDQYGQFEGDTVEVANPLPWWQRPRGDLVVHVHLCVEQGNEHLAKREVIDANVRALNEIHAPFYAWQSSGLLNVSFAAGKITIANDVASEWGLGYLPGSCVEGVLPIEAGLVGRQVVREAGVGHAVILAGNSRTAGGMGGWAFLGEHLGVTFVTDAANLTVADIKPLRTVRHELDHNIGQPHVFYGLQTIDGETRVTSAGPTRFIFPSLVLCPQTFARVC